MNSISEVNVSIPESTPTYYVLKKTWNRHILLGPHHGLLAKSLALDHARKGAERGGPVQFIQLSAHLGSYRVVRRPKGLIEIERQRRTAK